MGRCHLASINILLLTALLSACRQAEGQRDVDPLEGVLKEMVRLDKAYFDGGQRETDKTRLQAFLTETDAQFASVSAYNLEKGRVLQHLDDVDGWRAAFARVPDEDLNDPSDIFNRLQESYTLEPERAVALALRLARATEPRAQGLLSRWLHRSLAGQFAPKRRPFADSDRAQRLLAALRAVDDDAIRRQTVGLLRWLDSGTPPVSSSTAETTVRDFGTNEALAPRYALLTAQQLAQRPDGVAAADRLRTAVAESFDVSASSSGHRARERYWAAAGHAALAGSKRGSSVEQFRHLRAAASLSYDAQDLGALDEAQAEARILAAPSEFRSAYADHLENHGRAEEALRTHAELVVLDVSQEQGLRERFVRLKPAESFDQWWERTLPTFLPPAPQVLLRTFDGRDLGSANAPGTWTLLDFWGTWCTPCQPDMPKVDALYRQTQSSQQGRVITAAALDKAPTVRDYLMSRNFIYPVVLADDALIAAFNVAGFPTKLLIAPNGGVLRLPHDDTWEPIARRYLFKVASEAR